MRPMTLCDSAFCDSSSSPGTTQILCRDARVIATLAHEHTKSHVLGPVPLSPTLAYVSWASWLCNNKTIKHAHTSYSTILKGIKHPCHGSPKFVLVIHHAPLITSACSSLPPPRPHTPAWRRARGPAPSHPAPPLTTSSPSSTPCCRPAGREGA